MNREDFVSKLAERGYTKKAARVALTDFLDIITEALIDGEEIQFNGFGTFYVKQLKDKEGISMQTKERIMIPGRKMPRFIPGTTLKRCVREGVVRE